MGQLSKSQKELTVLQTKFVHAVIEGMNPHEACIAAGYSKNYARCKSTELMSHPAIKREIRKGLSRAWKNHELRLNKAIEIHADILETTVHDLVDMDTGKILAPNCLSKKAAGVINSIKEKTTRLKDGSVVVEVEYERDSKLKAIEMAYRLKGANAPDKVDVRQATIDLTQLHQTPAGAREPDRIEEMVDD